MKHRKALKRRYGRTASKARVKSAEELAQETEFYRRSNGANVDKKFVGPNDIVLHHHQLGEIGSKTNIMRRGKVAQVLYVLPSLGSLHARKWWPEPDALFNGGEGGFR